MVIDEPIDDPAPQRIEKWQQGFSSRRRRFQVRSSDLVSHAAEVDRIGDGLDTAKQAGAAVRVDSSAYGQLCQFVPALLDDLQARVVDGIGSAVTATRDTADALRSTAADYDTSDYNAADRLRKTR